MKSKTIKIKIEKSKGMSDLEVDALLQKAFHNDPHAEPFQDEGNQDAARVLSQVHDRLFEELLNEINEELDKE